MEKTIATYQSVIQQIQNKEDFDYILQAVFFEICAKEPSKAFEISQFIKSANLNGDLLEHINQLSDAKFTWSMLVFLEDGAFHFMIDFIYKLLATIIQEEVDLEAIKKVAIDFIDEKRLDDILQHYK